MVAEVQIDQATVPTHRSYPINDRLGPFSKVNLFIGANNSGKSRLLRSLWNSIKGLAFCDNPEILRLWYELATLPEFSGDSDGSEIRSVSANENPLIAFPIPFVKNDTGEAPLINQFVTTCRNFCQKVSDNTQESSPSKTIAEGSARMKFESTHARILQEKAIRFEEETKKYIISLTGNRSNDRQYPLVRYIPTLRGFRSAPHSKDNSGRLSYYDERTLTDYRGDMRNATDASVFTGGSFNRLYKEILLGKREDRDFSRNFEDFLSKYFFGGREISITPEIDSNKLLLEIGNEKERLLEHIGDGIQHLIIIVFAAFNLVREASDTYGIDALIPILLIEEPELFLHPGFQRQLMKALMSEELERIQIFATTQSNHLLEIGLESSDVAVFHISKERSDGPTHPRETPSFFVRSVPSDDRVLLDCLGVNQASVMLANCVLMVEGITDRWYLQRLLECYCAKMQIKSFILDLHYTFAEYGGACMSHYDFNQGDIKTSRLFGDYLCIADQDKSPWKEARNKKIKDILCGQRGKYEILPCREVENLMSIAVAQTVITVYYQRSKSPILALNNGNSASTSEKSVPVVDIYERYKEMSFFEDFGSSITKRAFCENALKELTSLEHFAPYAHEFAKKLYDFVANRNGELNSVHT
jgi:hypothetical protein